MSEQETVQRYSMNASNGSVVPCESANGAWIRFDAVKDVERAAAEDVTGAFVQFCKDYAATNGSIYNADIISAMEVYCKTHYGESTPKDAE